MTFGGVVLSELLSGVQTAVTVTVRLAEAEMLLGVTPPKVGPMASPELMPGSVTLLIEGPVGGTNFEMLAVPFVAAWPEPVVVRTQCPA